MSDDAYRVGDGLARGLKQSDSYAGEFEGEVFVYPERIRPKVARRVPALQKMYAEARLSGVALSSDPSWVNRALEGFLAGLREEQPSEFPSYLDDDEKPKLTGPSREDPGIWWVDFGP